jgi:hypothetical protein
MPSTYFNTTGNFSDGLGLSPYLTSHSINIRRPQTAKNTNSSCGSSNNSSNGITIETKRQPIKATHSIPISQPDNSTELHLNYFKIPLTVLTRPNSAKASNKSHTSPNIQANNINIQSPNTAPPQFNFLPQKPPRPPSASRAAPMRPKTAQSHRHKNNAATSSNNGLNKPAQQSFSPIVSRPASARPGSARFSAPVAPFAASVNTASSPNHQFAQFKQPKGSFSRPSSAHSARSTSTQRPQSASFFPAAAAAAPSPQSVASMAASLARRHRIKEKLPGNRANPISIDRFEYWKGFWARMESSKQGFEEEKEAQFLQHQLHKAPAQVHLSQFPGYSAGTEQSQRSELNSNNSSSSDSDEDSEVEARLRKNYSEAEEQEILHSDNDYDREEPEINNSGYGREKTGYSAENRNAETKSNESSSGESKPQLGSFTARTLSELDKFWANHKPSDSNSSSPLFTRASSGSYSFTSNSKEYIRPSSAHPSGTTNKPNDNNHSNSNNTTKPIPPQQAHSGSQSNLNSSSSVDELSVKELICQLQALNISTVDCVEKGELITKLKSARSDLIRKREDELIREKIIGDVERWQRGKGIKQLLNELNGFEANNGINEGKALYLTVSSDYSAVHKSYRRVLLKIHPDKHMSSSNGQNHHRATEMFKAVSNKFNQYRKDEEAIGNC